MQNWLHNLNKFIVSGLNGALVASKCDTLKNQGQSQVVWDSFIFDFSTSELFDFELSQISLASTFN